MSTWVCLILFTCYSRDLPLLLRAQFTVLCLLELAWYFYILLMRFTAIAWRTVTESTVLCLPELAWYSLHVTHGIYLYCLEDSHRIHSFMSTWACLILFTCYSWDLPLLLGGQSQNPQFYVYLSLPDTLYMLLMGFTSIAWRTVTESTVLCLPELAWYSLHVTHGIYLYWLEHSPQF